MNWNKIKTFLIFLFLAIDIFLLIWNIGLRQEGSRVDKNTIENMSELLSARGIKIPEGTVDAQIPQADIISVRNVMASEAEFVGGILGTKYKKDGNVFFNEDCSVKIEGNVFEIVSGQRVKSVGEARDWLSSMGFDMRNTVTSEYRGEYIFKGVYKGLELYGSRVAVNGEDGKTIATGSFFYVIEGTEKPADIRHSTAVLPKLVQEGIANCSVSSVNIGYRVETDGSKFSEANAMPAYRILLSDGREIFYNATK